MSDTMVLQLLELCASAVLVTSVLVLWRRGLRAIVRTLAVQGAAIAGVAALIGLRHSDVEAIVAAGLIVVVKVVAIPLVLMRVVRSSGETREVAPLVNIPASVLIAAILTLVAYATTRSLVAVAPSPETDAIPLGIAVVLIGFFVLVSRRKAVSQVVGFVLIDNGIAMVAFLATAGVPFVVELGASLDLVLAVLILQVFASRMGIKFGATDLDQLRELKD